MALIWKCDDCGGPAVWTLIRGETYYHCERRCDAFMQGELFVDDDGVTVEEPPANAGVQLYARAGDGMVRPTPVTEILVGRSPSTNRVVV